MGSVNSAIAQLKPSGVAPSQDRVSQDRPGTLSQSLTPVAAAAEESQRARISTRAPQSTAAFPGDMETKRSNATSRHGANTRCQVAAGKRAKKNEARIAASARRLAQGDGRQGKTGLSGIFSRRS